MPCPSTGEKLPLVTWPDLAAAPDGQDGAALPGGLAPLGGQAAQPRAAPRRRSALERLPAPGSSGLSHATTQPEPGLQRA